MCTFLISSFPFSSGMSELRKALSIVSLHQHSVEFSCEWFLEENCCTSSTSTACWRVVYFWTFLHDLWTPLFEFLCFILDLFNPCSLLIHAKRQAEYTLYLSSECKKCKVTHEVLILSNSVTVLTFPQRWHFLLVMELCVLQHTYKHYHRSALE